MKDYNSTISKDFVFQEFGEPLPDFETFNLPKLEKGDNWAKFVLWNCIKYADLKKAIQTAGFTDELEEKKYEDFINAEMDEILKNIWLKYPQIIRQETKKHVETVM